LWASILSKSTVVVVEVSASVEVVVVGISEVVAVVGVTVVVTVVVVAVSASADKVPNSSEHSSIVVAIVESSAVVSKSLLSLGHILVSVVLSEWIIPVWWCRIRRRCEVKLLGRVILLRSSHSICHLEKVEVSSHGFRAVVVRC